MRHLLSLLPLIAAMSLPSRAADEVRASFAQIEREYRQQALPLVKQYCLECHSTEVREGELDLQQFAGLAEIRRRATTWLKVAEMLDTGQMPPKEAAQPSPDERRQLRAWIERYLNAEAAANAGDPGPVVLRRLNNAQYTYTVHDLTGVPLEPAREFPADSAAGEGFTNAGGALAMSPALLTKYLDAGKELAAHAVLLSDGFRFSTATSRRDWTDEILARVRRTYLRYTAQSGGTQVNLQGLTWETNKGGLLPLARYLSAIVAERDALASGAKSPDAVAQANGLSPKYLTSLWNLLRGGEPSPLIDAVRARWRDTTPADVAKLAGEIGRWQDALVRFQSVGHMKSWMVPVDPLVTAQEIRFDLPAPAAGDEVTLYLAAGEAGDGNKHDTLIWQEPRLVTRGQPDLPLRDVRHVVRELVALRARISATVGRALAAADEASQAPGPIQVEELAGKHGIDADVLTAWLDYLGISATGDIKLNYLTGRIEQSAGYNFVQGWGTHETPLLVANSSDRHVRVPGNMKPHGIALHPSPTLAAAIAWRSPISGGVKIAGKVTSAHPECGNGVTWSLELRRGHTRRVLASGTATGSAAGTIALEDPVVVRPDDLVALAIGPRGGNHACDLTDVELVLTSTTDDAREWNLTRDLSGNILAGNPQADRFGNPSVWHFYTDRPEEAGTATAIPPACLVARWQSAPSGAEKQALAAALQKLLFEGPPADAAHPDTALYRQLTSLGGPLFHAARSRLAALGKPSHPTSSSIPASARFGLDPELFGRHPDGSTRDAANLCVAAPSVVEVRLPADLAAGSALVATAVLDPHTGAEGSVQLSAGTQKPGSLTELRPDAPVLVREGSSAQKRFLQAFAEFRRWFPKALCYIQIVPVDEVVTLTLFHREDEPLARLMLDDAEAARLDGLWKELHFVSQDAPMLVDAFEQLMEYATQDSDPKLFEPYRKPIYDAAAAHRQALLDAEPRQLDALVAFAEKAYRRPLSTSGAEDLRGLYRRLRTDSLSHEEAFRLTLARVFAAPAFLYRIEQAPAGAAPGPVSDWELAGRLSYFLWSSTPDDELGEMAAAGKLQSEDGIAAQARRMLRDARVSRLATEFAAQWLHIYAFDTLDEKSDRHFPEFAALRGDMYEESVRFFTDLFQRDGSVLSLLDADHTFVNGPLAAFYGIPAVDGADWRRVDGIGKYGRGGILGLASTLAKHSGASRTSPTLRGNWVSEVLLGEKLPKPPKGVPTLPEDEAAIQDLTVRQLVEKHASDASCAKCHVRIDPLGFALEGFDAIGRRREKDLAERPIDAHTRLADGTEFTGLAGLRDYLLTKRRDAFLDQFCRKLLGFALGRGVQLSDQPLIAHMRQQLAANDFRFSAAVEAIVRSRQFRTIRGRDAETAQAR
jgi:hypothetical protein